MAKTRLLPSLVELAEGNYPSWAVVETFRDYAYGGWAIKADTAITAISNANLSPEQLRQVQAHLLVGINDHARRCQGDSRDTELKEAEEYATVYEKISKDLK